MKKILLCAVTFLLSCQITAAKQDASKPAFSTQPLDPCKRLDPDATLNFVQGGVSQTFNPPYGRDGCDRVVVDIVNLENTMGTTVNVSGGSRVVYIVYGRRPGSDWQQVSVFPRLEGSGPGPGSIGPILQPGDTDLLKNYIAARVVAKAFADGDAAAVTIKVEVKKPL